MWEVIGRQQWTELFIFWTAVSVRPSFLMNGESWHLHVLTIPLKECLRRIAWPYSRVLWPPPCAACGNEGESCQHIPAVASLAKKLTWRFRMQILRKITMTKLPKNSFKKQVSSQWAKGDFVSIAMRHPRERAERPAALLRNGHYPGWAETQSCSTLKACKWGTLCLPSFELLRSNRDERDTRMK